MTLNKCVFFLMYCVKLVYCEATLVNFPNCVKLEFLQSDAKFHLEFTCSCLGEKKHYLQKPWCSWTDPGISLKGHPKSLNYWLKAIIGTSNAISKLDNGTR
jgi:hypothetical protein